MIYTISWWFIIQILGWVALPVAFRALRWLPDRGYTFSKPLGLLLVSVYAPVQGRGMDAERERFSAALLDFVYQLDMQTPTLLQWHNSPRA